MTVDEFFKKYNGKGIDFDGFYGFQCMDLAQQYVKDCVGGKQLGGPNAKDCWTNYPKETFDRITNTPTGVPQLGDIVIWGAMPGNVYGHIAVYYAGNTVNFTSFDQNWPVGSTSHFQVHNYNYVLGWLRPKVSPTPTPTPPSNNEQKYADALRKIRDIVNATGL